MDLQAINREELGLVEESCEIPSDVSLGLASHAEETSRSTSATKTQRWSLSITTTYRHIASKLLLKDLLRGSTTGLRPLLAVVSGLYLVTVFHFTPVTETATQTQAQTESSSQHPLKPSNCTTFTDIKERI